MTSAIRLILTLAAIAATAVRLSADVVTEWNSSALEAIRSVSQDSPYAARDLALLQTAIYNATESLSGNYTLYSGSGYAGPSGSAPGGASMDAAAAAAANTILQSLYPTLSGSFTSLYSTQLSGIADGQAKTDGISWGQSVANDMLSWRSGDGASTAQGTPYTPVGTVGHWGPTPSTYSAASLPGWGAVTPFAISNPSIYTSGLPGSSNADYLTSAAYATDYNQVLNLGGSTSGTRTVDQTNAAFFWSAGSGTITSAGMWNEVAQTVAASAGFNTQDTARLLAALNVALADSGIVAFSAKYDVDFWRPVSAIVFGDFDGNASSTGDGSWLPLIDPLATPGYISDEVAMAAAAAHVLAAYFGDLTSFTFGSDIDGDGSTDLTRSFSSFSEALAEAGMSRIYSGDQFLTDVTAAQASGALVGAYVTDNYFSVVPEPSAALLIFAAGVLTVIRRSSRVYRRTARSQ